MAGRNEKIFAGIKKGLIEVEKSKESGFLLMTLNEFLLGNNVPVEHQNLVLNRIEKARQDPSLLNNWDDASEKLSP